MEDLVADGVRLVGRGDRPEDARLRESLDDLADRLRRRARVLRQVVEPVGDLHPGRRHEVVEDARGLVALGRPERAQRPLEVLGDDPLGAAESRERREAERRRACRPLLLPEALHDELEVRRLDPPVGPFARDRAAALAAHVDPAALHLVEDGLDERGLDRHRRAAELAVALDRPHDRLAAAAPVEVLEPQVRDPRLERVELRERVLAQAEEEVRPQAGLADRRRELAREAGAGAVPLVEEVLLELVEDDVDVAADRFRRGLQRLDERPPALEADRLLDRLLRAPVGVARPRREDDDRRVVDRAHRVRDRGAEERALADAARPVQHRQPRGHEVGEHDLALALAAEEEQRVELRVLERSEALEGALQRLRADAHRAVSAGCGAR